MRALRLARLVLPVVLLLPLAALTAATHAEPAPPSAVGRWSAPFEGQVAAVNMVLLDDGRVLYWSGVEARERDHVFFLDHPAEGEARVVAPPYTNATVSVPGVADGGESDLFCSGQTVLADGRVLVAGGSEWTTLPSSTALVSGAPDVRVFSPDSTSFEDAADMALGRWYPSVVLLADGRAVAASGIEDLTDPGTHQTGLEVYDAGADAWSAVVGGDNLLPLYPRLFVVPGGPLEGALFYSTVGTMWGPFGEHPAEATWSLQQALEWNADGTASWRVLGPSVFGARQHGAVVPLLLDPDRGYAPELLTFGGTLQRSVVATPLAEVADLSTDPPTNFPVQPMAHGRWHLNGVLLPTGEVLAVGGGAYDNVVVHGQPNPPILPAEVFDPDARTWRTLAPMQVPRTYHSTAVLLPDARVLVGGHVPLPVPWKDVRDNVPTQEQIVETRLEIFEPPYLFRGPRPIVVAAPDHVGWNATFEVETPQWENATAVLLRPGSTTHAFDADQRGVELEVVARSAGKIVLRAPPNGAVAPPGAWMLFLLDDAGLGPVPSVAEFVRLG